MDPQTFRELGHQLVDWIADYREGVRERPVLPEVTPGEIRSRLPGTPPESGEDPSAIFADFEALLLPGMTHWNHPRFFAYFPANNSAPSILAEMLTAALGAQCMSWQTSPAATELEQVTLDWLRQMLGLDAGFTGVIHDTASTATLVALLMAREKATGFRFRREGSGADGADRLRVYTSTEGHSSIEKGAFLAGFGSDNLRRVAVDDAFAMRPDALAAALREDRAHGRVPAAVVATVGTTSSTAIDPIPEIAAVCRDAGVFLHVDAAFAGNAAILPEKRELLAGMDAADSFCFNPHKWLFVNFDCSVHYVRDPEALLATCAIDPEYLKTRHDENVVNYRDWGIQLGRRFRALKLWWVLRTFGVRGLQDRLREHLRLATLLEGWVAEAPDFELLAPTPVSLVCFRYRPPGTDDEAILARLNARLLEAVNATGRAFITHTVLDGRYTLRVVTAQEMTTEDDVRVVWDLIRDAASSTQ